MKQMFFAAMALMFLFSGNLRAEDGFALLRKQYQEVSDEWKNYIATKRRKLARKSLDPQARRDLRFHQDLVEDLIRTSREVHRALEKLKLGDDLPLVRHAENLRSGILLYERTAQNGPSGGEKSKDSPDLVFRVMEADLEGLEEIGFSCRNGVGTVSPEASAWPEFFRVKRQIRMLKLYLEAREKAVQMNMSPQKKNEILREMPDVTAAADRLSARIQQDFPDLKQEGLMLSALSRKLLEDANLQTPSAGLKKMASTAREKPSKPDQCLLQIAKILGTIEKRIRASVRDEEMMSEKPPREKPKTEPVRTPPASHPVRPKTGNVPERKREVPLERRSEEELNGELAGLRKRILPDANKDVLTADELERCLDLLSEKERKQYETIRLRRIRNGTGQYEAPLEALKELKELLTAPDAAFPTRQEKIRILKKVQSAETGK